jgi:hypothetical protein
METHDRSALQARLTHAQLLPRACLALFYDAIVDFLTPVVRLAAALAHESARNTSRPSIKRPSLVVGPLYDDIASPHQTQCLNMYDLDSQRGYPARLGRTASAPSAKGIAWTQMPSREQQTETL